MQYSGSFTCLRELTRHTGPHSVTCHPAEVTFPPLSPAKLVLNLATPEGCKAELTKLAAYIPRLYTRPKTVTHPSTNRARRTVTSLMRPTTLAHAAPPTSTFNGPFSGTTQVSRYRKVKPIWILLKQEPVSCSGISWATCKSTPRSRQITTPAPHHSVVYRPDALPATQPTASKHWKQ